MAERMQLSMDGKIRVHPIRLYMAKKLDAFANPMPAPAAEYRPSAMSPRYRNPNGRPGTRT